MSFSRIIEYNNFIQFNIFLNVLLFIYQELAKHIDDYTATYEPEDQLEWSLVLGEIRAFIEVIHTSY